MNAVSARRSGVRYCGMRACLPAWGCQAAGLDWTDKHKIGALKIADLACGTGTLLAASVQTFVDNFLRTVAGRLPGAFRKCCCPPSQRIISAGKGPVSAFIKLLFRQDAPALFAC